MTRILDIIFARPTARLTGANERTPDFRPEILLLLCLALNSCSSAHGQTLTEAEAYRQITHAISEQLDQTNRFTRLSQNISDLSIMPDGKPIFSILGGAREDGFKPDPAKKVVLKDEGAFFTTRFGTVVATHDKMVMLRGPAGREEQTFAECKGSSVKLLNLPNNLYPGKVFWAGRSWGFFTAGGVLLDDATNFPASAVFETKSGVVMITPPDERTAWNTNSHFIITVKDQHGMKQSLFKGYHQFDRNLQGLVALDDGRFVAVTDKIILLREDCPAGLTDTEASALISAFTRKDKVQLKESLRVATEYPPNELYNLSRLLRALPDPAKGYAGLEQSANYLLDSIGRMDSVVLADTNLDRVRIASQALAATSREFLRQLDEVRSGGLGVSPHRAADLMLNGWQYYAGYWIRKPQSIRQDGVVSVLLDLEYMDSDWKPSQGVFRLDHTGRLEFLFQNQRDEFTPPCQLFTNAAGEELVFLPFEGLARHSGGELEWLDRSDEMKRLERVIGCDRQGRIYFGSRTTESIGGTGSSYDTPSGKAIWAAFAPNTSNYWVYRPRAKPAGSPIGRLFPVAHIPIMDGAGRIWFSPMIPPTFSKDPAPGNLFGSPAAIEGFRELASVQPRSMHIQGLPQAGGRSFGLAELAASLDLFCYEDGRLYRCLTNLPKSTVLLAGAKDYVIGTTRDRSDHGVFIVENGESATVAPDLHDMAQKEFPLLVRAAPLQSELPGHNFQNEILHNLDYNPSVCRVADRVWINDHDKLDVYADGKSTGFRMKMTIPSRSLTFSGPVAVATNDQRMFISSGASLVWADALGEDELTVTNELNTARSLVTPGLSRENDVFYMLDGRRRFWRVQDQKFTELPADAGNPVLELKNGDLITHVTLPYDGYRVVSEERIEDLPGSFGRPLTILAETAEGRLLCASAEGILWLVRNARGKFTVGEEIPLNTGGHVLSYIGQDAGHVYLTLCDARLQAYLAVVEKK
jgi:hypothetical protein